MEYLPKAKRQCHPQENANFLSKLVFFYTVELFQKSGHTDLDSCDLYDAPSTLKAQKLGEHIEGVWKKKKAEQKKSSIFVLLLKCHGLYYFCLGLTQLSVKITLIILRPFFVTSFASFFLTQTDSSKNVSLYGSCLVILVMVESWYDQWYSFHLRTLEIQIRASLISFIYRKCLKLSSFYSEDTSLGKIVTLITKDVDNIEKLVRKANEIWLSVIQACVLFFVLFRKVGFVSLAVIILSTVFFPMQVAWALKSTTIKAKMLRKTDKRLELTKDIFFAFKIIKMYTWEKFFTEKLSKLRLKELQPTHQIFFLKFILNINGFLWMCATFFLWMALCVALKKEITSGTIFFMLDLYRTINNLLIVNIPRSLCQIGETVPTIKRIDAFLSIKESSTLWKPTKNPRIFLKNVKATIKKETVLRNLNLDFDIGLVLITGPNSSGKSVLLKTILGECKRLEDEINIEGSISYASQKPWLFPSTIRQNILFGEDFDEKRYNQVLKACDLNYDLQWFESGDQTLIQDNGTNLSEGQRVRINLARALYKESDIYLLDDFLAPLDAISGQYIFEECIKKRLYNKLVILVTQDHRLIEKTRSCLILDNGEAISLSVNKNSHVTHISELRDCPENPQFIDDEVNEETPLLFITEKKNVFEETKKNGKVEYKVYWTWIKSGGGVLCFFFVTSLLVLRPMMMGFFEQSVNSWAMNEEIITNCTKEKLADLLLLPKMLNRRQHFIALFVALILCLLITTLASSLILLNFNKQASLEIYRKVVKTVISAKVQLLENSFFGNILNRFSRDFLILDEVIPFLYYDLFTMIIPLVVIVSVVVNVEKMFLAFLIILLLTFLYLKKIFLNVARSLKRLEASSKSPVVSYFESTLKGLATIKTKDSSKILQDEFDAHLDLYTSASYTYLSVTKAFSLVIGWISSFFTALVVTRLILFGGGASDVTFILYQTFLLVPILNTIFVKWAEIETHMTSVERILEMTEIQQESEGLIDESPDLGKIKFENVSLFYNTRKGPVLSNLNFVIHPKEKIGIVGRTGAGKTSLISTLLRLCDFEGTVSVNGVDVKTSCLEFLRYNISVIPQNPIIFKGTVRDNLDPFCEHGDNDLWEVLNVVGLKKLVWDLNVDIYKTFIAFNSRHKQLLCLARIIIENNSIVVLDNFIANIDKDVETLICNLMQTTFLSCTVVTVTNNWTILSCCDRLLILDKGQLVDFDTPLSLKNKKPNFLSQIIN